ncbi:putative ABC transport system ATP-binding protein [Paucilactobacillus hokkaidonensis JCM 18461]|uniref:ABC transporter ATP-binding protein n=3 Tax=Paucilactobacillus hokkaidonensis TaxID=1193095 RepID=A0ABR5Q523_9LACO|nr:ABC transporter ATP-binding protein [Paucilactobacillus hokkaidonensis]KRO09302.1 ABC transporter ATP-binding protein [Paucilactobacillus hokkaidonensis]BAP85286.1 putative ABC transport system ATP-binding protein [Paucilactobacillus hokkaidonensis JCM 18461]
MKNASVVVTGLTKKFDVMKQSLTVLENLNFEIKQGEFVSIVGESGSGKSTLLNILALLDNSFEGQYELAGLDITKLKDRQLSLLRRDKIGFIFQDFMLLPNLTVEQNILLQMEYLTPVQQNKVTVDYVEFLLQKVGLIERINYLPAQLSGGQKQRVAIARALLNQPDIIVADEPTGALDSKTSVQILELLQKFNESGQTVIVVTHSEKLAKQTDRQLLIHNRSIDEVTK